MKVYSMFAESGSQGYLRSMSLQWLLFRYWRDHDLPMWETCVRNHAVLNEETGEIAIGMLAAMVKSFDANNLELINRRWAQALLYSEVAQDFEMDAGRTTTHQHRIFDKDDGEVGLVLTEHFIQKFIAMLDEKFYHYPPYSTLKSGVSQSFLADKFVLDLQYPLFWWGDADSWGELNKRALVNTRRLLTGSSYTPELVDEKLGYRFACGKIRSAPERKVRGRPRADAKHRAGPELFPSTIRPPFDAYVRMFGHRVDIEDLDVKHVPRFAAEPWEDVHVQDGVRVRMTLARSPMDPDRFLFAELKYRASVRAKAAARTEAKRQAGRDRAIEKKRKQDEKRAVSARSRREAKLRRPAAGSGDSSDGSEDDTSAPLARMGRRRKRHRPAPVRDDVELTDLSASDAAESSGDLPLSLTIRRRSRDRGMPDRDDPPLHAHAGLGHYPLSADDLAADVLLRR